MLPASTSSFLNKLKNMQPNQFVLINLPNQYINYGGNITISFRSTGDEEDILNTCNYMLCINGAKTTAYFVDKIEIMAYEGIIVIKYAYDYYVNSRPSFEYGYTYPYDNNPNLSWDARGTVIHSDLLSGLDYPRTNTYLEEVVNYNYAIVLAKGTIIRNNAQYPFIGIAALNTQTILTNDLQAINEINVISSINSTQQQGHTIKINQILCMRGEIGQKITPYFNLNKQVDSVTYLNLPDNRLLVFFGIKDNAYPYVDIDVSKTVLEPTRTLCKVSTPKHSIDILNRDQEVKLRLFYADNNLLLRIISNGNDIDISSDFEVLPDVDKEISTAYQTALINNKFNESIINQINSTLINRNMLNKLERRARSFANAAYNVADNKMAQGAMGMLNTEFDIINSEINTNMAINDRTSIASKNDARACALSVMKDPSNSSMGAMFGGLVYVYEYQKLTNLDYDTEGRAYYEYYGYAGNVYMRSLARFYNQNIMPTYLQMEDVIIEGKINDTQKRILKNALEKGIKFI